MKFRAYQELIHRYSLRAAAAKVTREYTSASRVLQIVSVYSDHRHMYYHYLDSEKVRDLIEMILCC